jgi:hypothetical protein
LTDGLDVVALRVADERRVVVRVDLLSDSGRAVVASSGSEPDAWKLSTVFRSPLENAT